MSAVSFRWLWLVDLKREVGGSYVPWSAPLHFVFAEHFVSPALGFQEAIAARSEQILCGIEIPLSSETKRQSIASSEA